MGAKIIPFGAQNIFDSLLPLAEFLLKAIFFALAEFPCALFSAVRGTNVQLATAENNKWNNFCPIFVQPLGYCRLGLVTLPL
ncbi:MAG: hypothetical protein IJO68_07055 [Clostridia bacterium]|nr:hypothetical protein [Clostridia bacterium]